MHCTKVYGASWNMEEAKTTSVGTRSGMHVLEIGSAVWVGRVVFDAVAVDLP